MLEHLSAEYSAVEEVTAELAKSLALLSLNMEGRKAEEINDKLQSLIQENPVLADVIEEFLEERNRGGTP